MPLTEAVIEGLLKETFLKTAAVQSIKLSVWWNTLKNTRGQVHFCYTCTHITSVRKSWFLEQRKLHRIQYFGRRDWNPVASLFSYFDSGRERIYFTHLGPICPASNNFFFNNLICAIIETLYSSYSFKRSSQVSCLWSLVTGEESPKAVALSLVVHRLTGSKKGNHKTIA